MVGVILNRPGIIIPGNATLVRKVFVSCSQKMLDYQPDPHMYHHREMFLPFLQFHHLFRHRFCHQGQQAENR